MLWWIYIIKLIILSLYNCLNIKLQNDDLKSLLSQFGSTRCFYRFHMNLCSWNLVQDRTGCPDDPDNDLKTILILFLQWLILNQ